MKLYDLVPFISFLILALMIYGQIIHLKKKGVSIYSSGKKSAFIKYILYPSFILVLIFVVFQLIKPAFHISYSILPELLTNSLVESILFQIIGLLFTIVSLAFMGLTLHNFKSSLRFGMDSDNLGKLKTRGVFSISRNPFFVSIELYFIGVVFLFVNLFFIVITLLTIVSIHFFIRKEERFLSDNYGNEYKDYTLKVRRYF